jgi:hypothetical protein
MVQGEKEREKEDVFNGGELDHLHCPVCVTVWALAV